MASSQETYKQRGQPQPQTRSKHGRWRPEAIEIRGGEIAAESCGGWEDFSRDHRDHAAMKALVHALFRIGTALQHRWKILRRDTTAHRLPTR